jgi:hypothetical protein
MSIAVLKVLALGLACILLYFFSNWARKRLPKVIGAAVTVLSSLIIAIMVLMMF